MKTKITNQNQQSFIKTHWKFKYSHGGVLRQKRLGRKFRPLSKKEPIHLVFKARREHLREKSFRGLLSYRLSQKIIRRYAARFYVRIDQYSVQGDHIHLLIRCSTRFFYQAFFRVVAGQMAQRFRKEGLITIVTDTPGSPKLWLLRPFTRVVKGWRAYKIVRAYIQLNEKEVLGEIRYNKKRLVGLSAGEWAILWN